MKCATCAHVREDHIPMDWDPKMACAKAGCRCTEYRERLPETPSMFPGGNVTPYD